MNISKDQLVKIFAGLEVTYIESNINFILHLEVFGPDFLDLVIKHCRDVQCYSKVIFYSKLACKFFPDSWHGYVRLAKEMLRKHEYSKCRVILDKGIANVGNNFMLLCTYSDLERASGDRVQSLSLSRKIKECFPGNYQGYVREIQDLIATGDLQSASLLKEKIPTNLLSRREVSDCLAWLDGVLKADLATPVLMNAWLHVLSSAEFNENAYSEINLYQGIPSIFTQVYPFQYWSQGKPPKKLAEISDQWNCLFSELSIKPITIWDKRQALEWIESNAPDFFEVFRSAPHYASEADIFRLLMANNRKSIWIDSDYYPKQMTKIILRYILSREISSLVMLPPSSKPPYINNAFFTSVKSCPFFGGCVESMKGFDFSGKAITQHLVSSSFGPGLYNRIFKKIFDNPIDVSLETCIGPYIYEVRKKSVAIQIVENTTFAYNKKPGLDMNSLQGYSNWKNL